MVDMAMVLDGASAAGAQVGKQEVIAAAPAGKAAGYAMRGVIENHGGATRLVGAPSVTTLGEANPAWDATVQADDAHDALLVVVTGYPGLDIRWVATVRTAEVAW